MYRRSIEKEVRELMSASAEKKVLDLASKGGILRPRDLQSKRLPTDYLRRLHQKEKLERVGRGMYAIPGAGLSDIKRLSTRPCAYPTAWSVCFRLCAFTI